MMARHGVLVRRLNAIENLGSVDILCTDKTGTLTEGVVRVEGIRCLRSAIERGPRSGSLECGLETGVASPLDDAILQARTPRARRHSQGR
jgi:Mg2+-importing ATPase